MKTLLLAIALISCAAAYAEEKSVETLKQEIYQKRIEIVNAETEAQGLLQTNWKEYSEKIKEVERKEGELEAMEQQLQRLQER